MTAMSAATRSLMVSTMVSDDVTVPSRRLPPVLAVFSVHCTVTLTLVADTATPRVVAFAATLEENAVVLNDASAVEQFVFTTTVTVSWTTNGAARGKRKQQNLFEVINNAVMGPAAQRNNME